MVMMMTMNTARPQIPRSGALPRNQPGATTMSHNLKSKAAFCVLAAALTGPLYAQEAKPPAHEERATSSCAQVEDACKSAGFIEHDVGQGKGLWEDCFNPVVEGRPAPKTAKLALPHVDEKVVAACRAEKGKGKKATAKETNPKE